MSRPHEALADILKWAQDPDKWQWRWYSNIRCKWIECDVAQALSLHEEEGTAIQVVPKRDLIPADKLPEGWEVERVGDGYEVTRQPNNPVREFAARYSALGELLRHYDPKVKR